MADSNSQRAKELIARWNLNVQHALYRKTGNWYHRLNRFPGALLDADGYVIFDDQREFEECPHLQIGKQVGAPKGIKAIAKYIYAPTLEGQQESLAVEMIIRGRSIASGQRRGGSPENRKAIELHAMALAKIHYSITWCEVADVSASEPFDLLCRDGDRELRVEVKGTSSLGRSILLTRNEVHHAKANPDKMALFVVSSIAIEASGLCSGGVVEVIEPWDIQQSELDPIAFECWLERRPSPRTRMEPTRLGSRRRG